MKGRPLFGVALAALVVFPLHAAHAGFQYQSTIVEDDQNPTDFHLIKPGASKVIIKPSTKAGDGGLTIQLNLKNVDCASEGNDKDKTGKCGVKDTGGVKNHVLELNLRALGTDIPSATLPANGAGILFNIVKGKAAFASTGKNKTGVGPIFGTLASQIFNKPLGIGLIKLRTSASDPTACNTAPLLPGNGCNDGDVYAFAGIVVPVDQTFACNADANCPVQDFCDKSSGVGICTVAPCVSNDECRSGAFCDINAGQCCDPNITVGCGQ